MARFTQRYTPLNPYKIMWIIVLFDLPTNTKTERKAASKFRQCLLKDGFHMMQYSVYARHCPNKSTATVHAGRVKKNLPREGHVQILRITDRQYANMANLYGRIAKKPKHSAIQQLELF